MAPTNSWVLLKRRIFIEHDASETGGDSLVGERNRRDAVLAYLRILKPEARFANPPELSSLRILRPARPTPGTRVDVKSAYIASGDKNLLALFAGPYRPGTNSKGGYLIYDASKNSLSTIPPPPYDYGRADVGMGAAIMCLEEGAYVLVELTKVRDSDPCEAALCTWHSSTAEWVTKVASFPPELSFRADMCFSYRGSRFCWVDLLKGVLVCNLDALLRHGVRPELRFVPLPGECPTYDRDQKFRQQWPLQAEQFRYIACIGGIIKLVTMDGYGERPGNEVTLTIWTLSPDLRSWKKGKAYHVKDIWASESHRSLGLPEVLPSFPVLSMDEEDVVYLFFTDVLVTEDGDSVFRSHCLIRVDMKHNKVSHHPKSADEMPFQLFSSEILATECSAYLSRLIPNPFLIILTH
ncbi:hypothetical protein VPH35_064759 [Triticum aestivum]